MPLIINSPSTLTLLPQTINAGLEKVSIPACPIFFATSRTFLVPASSNINLKCAFSISISITTIDSRSTSPSINCPTAVAPKIEIPSLFRISQTASRFCLKGIKTIAKVGLKPSAMLSARADLISSGDFPLIVFAFIIIFDVINFC